MPYSETMQNAILRKDIAAVRSAIIGQIDADRQLSEPQGLLLARKASADLKAQGIILFEQDSGNPKYPASNDWNFSTWTKSKTVLYTNFSLEKVEMAEKILLELRKKGLPEVMPVSKGLPSNHVSPQSSPTSGLTIQQKNISSLNSNGSVLSKNIKTIVAQGDIVLIRSILIGQLDADRQLIDPEAISMAEEIEKYLASQGVSLFEANTGEITLPTEDEWSLATWTKLKTSLYSNFSREKFALTANVLLSLRKRGFSEVQPLANNHTGKIGNETKELNHPDITPHNIPSQTQRKPDRTHSRTTDGHGYAYSNPRPLHPHGVKRQSPKWADVILKGGLITVGATVVGAVVFGTVGAIITAGIGVGLTIAVSSKN